MENLRAQMDDLVKNHQIQFAMEFCAWSFYIQDRNKNYLFYSRF